MKTPLLNLLGPAALRRAASLDRAIGRALAAWHDDDRTRRRYDRNARKLEREAG